MSPGTRRYTKWTCATLKEELLTIYADGYGSSALNRLSLPKII